MKKISSKKLGFILLGSLLGILSIIFIVFGATGIGFSDTRLKDANNSIPVLVTVKEVSYNKEVSKIDTIEFENPKRKNVYVKVGIEKENVKLNVWAYSNTAITVEGETHYDRGGGELKRRDNYYEFVCCFDYFDINRIEFELNSVEYVTSVGVYFI